MTVTPARRALALVNTRTRLTLVAATAALLLVTSTGTAAAAPVASTRLAAAADAVVASGEPGVVVYVRDHARTTVLTRGYADIATERPASARDHFRVGSVSKSFVATIVMQLSAEHKLGLGDSVEKYLPGLVPDGKAITIRELLWHTSGLFDYFGDQDVVTPYLTGHLDHVWTPRQLVQMAVKHKPLFPPGAPGQQSYSNTGYVLLGLIVEKVTGHSYASEVERRITKPLGLKDTSLDLSTRLPAPYAHGYSKVFDGHLRNASGWSGSAASFTGGMVSTPADVADFYRALLTGRLLPHRLVAEMEHRAVTVDGEPSSFILGPGLFRQALPCSLVWGHNGDFPGYHTSAYGSANGVRQVVVLVNSDEDYSWTKAEKKAVDHLVDVAYCG